MNKNNNEKYCFYHWLINDIKKREEELAKEKEKHQTNLNNFSGYEDSEEGKERREKIARMEKWISSHKEQLSELACLKNSTCGNKGEGTNMKWCLYCGKYLSLSIDYYQQDSSLKHDYYKSPDFYTHEQDCQTSNQIKFSRPRY